jgi:hypothetical protein
LDVAPDWVTDLTLAEKWHIPPWEIENEAPLLWVARQSALSEVLASKVEKLK